MATTQSAYTDFRDLAREFLADREAELIDRTADIEADRNRAIAASRSWRMAYHVAIQVAQEATSGLPLQKLQDELDRERQQHAALRARILGAEQ